MDQHPGFTPERKLKAITMLAKMNRNGNPLERVDAYDMAIEWQETQNEHIDWHEFSILLDWLHTLGYIKHVGFGRDGQAQYSLKW